MKENMNKIIENKWDIEVRSDRKALDLNLKELIKCKDLIIYINVNI